MQADEKATKSESQKASNSSKCSLALCLPLCLTRLFFLHPFLLLLYPLIYEKAWVRDFGYACTLQSSVCEPASTESQQLRLSLAATPYTDVSTPIHKRELQSFLWTRHTVRSHFGDKDSCPYKKTACPSITLFETLLLQRSVLPQNRAPHLSKRERSGPSTHFSRFFWIARAHAGLVSTPG